MESGHPQAHETLGIFLLQDDKKEAIRIFKEGAEAGFPSAMNAFALMGLEHKTEGRQAHQWFRRAAELGHVDSMWMTGIGYFHGNGVKKDLSEAFRWYRRAAEREHTTCMREIATMYFNGEGVPRNRELWRADGSL